MRLLDFVVGFLGLVVLGGLLLLLSAFGLRFEVSEQIIVGRGARLFRRRRLSFREGRLAPLATRLHLNRVGDCVSLLGGGLALVGPRPLAPLEPHAFASYRVAMRPGLITPISLAARGDLRYESEDAVDFAYAKQRRRFRDIALLLAALRRSPRLDIGPRASRGVVH